MYISSTCSVAVNKTLLLLSAPLKTFHLLKPFGVHPGNNDEATRRKLLPTDLALAFLCRSLRRPFLILLSLTGIVYLFKPQLDNLLYPQLMKVTPATQTLSADQLLAKATIAMPDASLRKYLPRWQRTRAPR